MDATTKAIQGGINGMTLNEAITKLVLMREHSMMPRIIKPNFDEVIETISECVEPSEIPHWIPILDGDGQMPEVDDEGYSDYILLSFRNASFLCIGQYRVDEEGGAFYEGDDEDPLTKIGLFVNAWMPLPERYKGNEDV